MFFLMSMVNLEKYKLQNYKYKSVATTQKPI
jgi:hypothetical protein